MNDPKPHMIIHYCAKMQASTLYLTNFSVGVGFTSKRSQICKEEHAKSCQRTRQMTMCQCLIL